MIRVVCLDETIRNVRDVEAGIRLSSDVDLPLVHIEGVDELFVEASEFSGELHLIRNVGLSLRVTHTDRLLDPYHVGQVGPAVRVLDRAKRARFPGEWAILGQEPT